MKKLLTFVLVSLLGLSLVGCSSSPSTSTDDPATDAPVTFVVGNTDFAGEFMQGWGNSSYDNNIRKLVDGNEGFFTPNADNELVLAHYLESYTTEKVPNPNYVEGGEEAAELEVWSFTVKEGIKFSDGEDFTTEDILFTYELYSHPTFLEAKGSGSHQPNFIYGFDDYVASCDAGACDISLLGIEVVDDYNIKFTIAEPVYTIKSEFAYFMYAKHQMAPDGVVDVNVIQANYMSSPIGVGPYKITEWNPGSDVQLTINEYYTGNINGVMPTVDNIVVRVVPTETDIDMLINGEIDMIQGQIEPEKIEAAKADPNLTFNNYPRHGYGHITWHTDFGATAYTEMRLAIAYAFDKETFVQLMCGDYGSPVAASYSPHFWMIDDAWIEENVNPLSYDPAMARSILEDAGWAMNADGIYEKDGVVAEIRIATGGSPWPDYLNNTLANSVEESGIKFTIDTVDFSVLLDHYYGLQPLADRIYNGFALATSYNPEFDGYVNNHSDFVYPFGEQSSTNQSRWVNEENDRLLELMNYAAAGTEEGDAQYQQAYRDWVVLNNQENPVLPIYANDYHDLYNAKFENLVTGPMWDWPYAIVEATVAE